MRAGQTVQRAAALFGMVLLTALTSGCALRIIAAHAEAVGAYRGRMRALNADYDTTTEQLAAAVTEYNEQRFGLQTELAELIAEMKAATTAEEWKAIAKYQLKKLEPRELIYGPAGGGS